MLSIGVGSGLLLHWLMPAVDVGMSVLIGTIACSPALYFLTQFFTSLPLIDLSDEGDDERIEQSPDEVDFSARLRPIKPLKSGGARRIQRRRPPQ